MKPTLQKLLSNIFDPQRDDYRKLPDTAGAYLICSKNIDKLPNSMKNLEFKFVEGLPVLYVGIAGRPTSKVRSLRKRDYKTHFNGTARQSTLRKSLGVLFGFEKVYGKSKKRYRYKFVSEHEGKLSEWMHENLIMHFVEIENPMEFEKFMICTYEPPLNLQGNYSEMNIEFRKALKKLRN
jgi:hypothetical protein